MLLLAFLEPTFQQLIDNLNKEMEKHPDRQELVSHTKFKEFLMCSKSSSLYQTILDSILSERHSDKRTILQEKRATALIWQLLFYRNQKHGEFMDESSLFLDLHGLSSSGMALGKVLGFARDNKTKTGQRPQICRGGICSDAVIQEMQKFWPDYCGQSFLESLPQPFKDVDPHTMQQSLKELRVYTREDREECQTLKSTVLIDEVEKSLHSKNDYHDCHQYIFEVIPEFQHFLKLNVAPTVGDWPTWYFQKKIVCHAPQGLEVLSLIPELGQFHVYLNSSEDVVKLYNPVFKEIYTAVFGERVRLAEKPKPDKVALCLVLGFCGWQRIRAQVRQAFGNCKDVEYVCLNHLFEELIPLCYLHYPVIVKGGNMVLLQKAMKRLALMFVAMDRHHYNKACLSWISDNEHQKENFPQYHQAKTKLCSVLTEKKVEIFHSTLRSRIKKTDNGDKIQETARLIARSNFDNDGFEQSYVPNYQRGYSDQDLMLLSDVTKLSYSWNVGLLSGLNDDDNDGDGDGDDAGDDGGDSGNQMKPTTSKKDVKYFESEEFDKYIQERITSIVGLVKGKLKNNHEE
ncbi:hypothetical protein QZH41_006633 [Actinostola sp. cb2023]|nr:hypothetical protein QZH41_006633 [Actinostola sp. cb2023]